MKLVSLDGQHLNSSVPLANLVCTVARRGSTAAEIACTTECAESAARCRLASRRGEEHRGHDRRQILSCGWVSIHLVVNDEITKDRTLANPPLRPLWATCVTVVRHSRQRGKASRTLRTRVRRTEEGKRGRRRRRRGRGQERRGEKRKRKGGSWHAHVHARW